MAVITPNSDVILLKVPLEISDANQLTFASATAQYNYFYGLPKLTFDKFTYQRKDNTIRVPALVDTLYSYNYVMYRNTNHSSKWFYAYITDLQYISDSVTAISIKTDVWQTYQFELTYKPCFIEREHVNDDTIGSHTIEEGLDLGEYVINSSTTLKPNKVVKDYDDVIITGLYYPIVFQVTGLTTGISIASTMFDAAYNGVFSGLKYFAVTSYAAARDIISRYDSDQNGNEIVSLFLAPLEFLAGAKKFGELGYNIYIPQDSGTVTTLLDSTTITRPTKLNNYTPKNNKLFTYPYSYMYVTNNVGTNTEFRYEDFASATPKFFIAGSLGQGCTTKLCPISYKSYTANSEVFEYGVIGAKYPVCAWSSDYYTNWVTQNAVNLGISTASGVAGAVISASYGNMIGAGASIVSSVGGILSKVHEAKTHPDQAKGNANSSDILIGWQRYFTVDCMSIRAEMARVIDDYFSAYGYKVNIIKVPNVTGRTNWNFVKTIGCYIKADIPQEDLNEIKSLFDKGITFWHNPTTFMDYSQSNAIVS